MDGGKDLRVLYARELAARGFHADPAQLAVIGRLAGLRQRLIGTRTARWGRWLAALTRPRAAGRGLYLWGGVGRGKTWLMDLFFDSLPFAERRRQHFHRFMHQVHAQLAAPRRAPPFARGLLQL